MAIILAVFVSLTLPWNESEWSHAGSSPPPHQYSLCSSPCGAPSRNSSELPDGTKVKGEGGHGMRWD